MGMGSMDVVPGVSGGTIAFITGIYETLLESIKKVDLEALTLLRKFEIKALWNHVNGNFLFPLLAGIGTSVLSLATVMVGLLETYPIQVWSFFFGLIIISALIVLKSIKHWNIGVLFAIIIGAVIAYLITSSTPAETPEGAWFLFVAGAVAICAMILPGISGSFILLLFGKYEYVLSALKEFRIVDILIFAAGCLVGILSFSRLVSWLLKKYYQVTIGILAGFMLGSLYKVWPWKETLKTFVDRHGEVKPLIERNIFPDEYLAKTGHESFFLQAVLFAAGGLLLVFTIDRIAAMLNPEN